MMNHTSTYTHMHICKYVHTHAHMHVCMNPCTHTYTYSHMNKGREGGKKERKIFAQN